MEKKRIIVSGGGTAGHIYPAVAVAEALTAKYGEGVELLFIGAEGRMEMERVPALGYKIEALPIAGLRRGLYWSNLLLPFKLMASLLKARRILREFKPHAVAGFGGYASGPIVRMAQRARIPTLIQEQNSYPGVTNIVLGRRAKAVCVAYEGMDRFFDAEKVVLTGNPLRGNLSSAVSREEGLTHFGLREDLQTVLVVGGSLGTRTLNEMMCRWIEQGGSEKPLQVIWQTGRYYSEEMQRFMESNPAANVWQGAFIERMECAYAAADLVISRSGAGAVSELSLLGKATIFVPSPNVAEDHQTKNAQALVERGAALMVRDTAAQSEGMELAERTLEDKKAMSELSKKIAQMGIADAAQRVVAQIESAIESK